MKPINLSLKTITHNPEKDVDCWYQALKMVKQWEHIPIWLSDKQKEIWDSGSSMAGHQGLPEDELERFAEMEDMEPVCPGFPNDPDKIDIALTYKTLEQGHPIWAMVRLNVACSHFYCVKGIEVPEGFEKRQTSALIMVDNDGGDLRTPIQIVDGILKKHKYAFLRCTIPK